MVHGMSRYVYDTIEKAEGAADALTKNGHIVKLEYAVVAEAPVPVATKPAPARKPATRARKKTAPKAVVAEVVAEPAAA